MTVCVSSLDREDCGCSSWGVRTGSVGEEGRGSCFMGTGFLGAGFLGGRDGGS